MRSTILCLLVCVGAAWSSTSSAALIACCSSDNDLYVTLRENKIPCARVDTPMAALDAAQAGDGILLLSESYPKDPTTLSEEFLSQSKARHLRVYVEFPQSLPALAVGTPRQFDWGRGVVASAAFGSDLPERSILDLHQCQFVPVTSPASNLLTHIVIGRVAGFSSAIFGLPSPSYPLLLQVPQLELMAATTKLSQFASARYSPTAAWTPIWKMILQWLDPSLKIESFAWQPSVTPSYDRNSSLPNTYEMDALRRGVDWFKNGRLLATAAREAEIMKAPQIETTLPPPPGSPIGDGSDGILEGFSATILPDGTQLQRTPRRCDCTAESAMALAFGGQLFQQPGDGDISKHLLDFLYFTSDARKREYANPTNGAYGLIAWGMNNPPWFIATYGDDEARVLLGTMAASSLLDDHRWDKAMMQCLLADLRTTGKLGFRGERLDVGPLTQNGWRHYFGQSPIDYSPHYESYIWACYLWAWHATGYELFHQRAESGIRMMMEAYPNQWRLVTGLQEDRAHMLLPLAWLVRLDDTPQHRSWLRQMAVDLLATQDASGALPEQLSDGAASGSHPPKSNAAYGTTEATLLQQNGDAVSDLLYTMNFAFLGLHEAAAATGDKLYSDGEDRVAEFLARIQMKSSNHPELDGGWCRAFDFQSWDYWASSSDLGWGVWSIESGWTQSWICAVLAMRHNHSSLWDLSLKTEIQRYFAELKPVMIPE